MIAAILLIPTRYFNERGFFLQKSCLTLCAGLAILSVCQASQKAGFASSTENASAETQPQWVQPIALIRDLESLEPFHFATHWAATTIPC